MTANAIRTVHFEPSISMSKEGFTEELQRHNATDIAVFLAGVAAHELDVIEQMLLSSGRIELQI